jgi:hypothetical protein
LKTHEVTCLADDKRDALQSLTKETIINSEDNDTDLISSEAMT